MWLIWGKLANNGLIVVWEYVRRAYSSVRNSAGEASAEYLVAFPLCYKKMRQEWKVNHMPSVKKCVPSVGVRRLDVIPTAVHRHT